MSPPAAAPDRARVRLYVEAVKPGIVVSNTLLAAAAYAFAADSVSIGTLSALVLGTAAVVASGCLLNNHFDRGIDARMRRTQGRGQVTGAISPARALALSGALGVGGTILLAVGTTVTTAALGVLAWILYALVYTAAKQRTVHATLIGTIPGAVPPVAGVAAGAGQALDAIVLFAVLVAWQIVHFYAISIRRSDDYARAAVPVPALAYGLRRTKRVILIGAAAHLAAIVALGLLGTAGVVFTVILMTGGTIWLLTALAGQGGADPAEWASRLFRQSLVLIALLTALLPLNRLLP